jgi:hypothetical protein
MLYFTHGEEPGLGQGSGTLKNRTAARTAKDKDPGDRQKKQVARLAAARDKVELKVAKLREQLARAENKLAKHTARLDSAGAGTTHEIPPIAEPAAQSAAEPTIAAAPSASLPYEGEQETPAPRATSRGSSRQRPKSATAPVPVGKTRKVHRNSHVTLPASGAMTDDGTGKTT